MARSRKAAPDEVYPDLREKMAGKYDELAERYRDQPGGLRHFGGLAARFRSDEPVIVSGWQLPRYVAVTAGRPSDWFRVETDGRVVPCGSPVVDRFDHGKA